MKKTILILLVMISLGAAGQVQTAQSKMSMADSLIVKHQIDSINTLVRTKMLINAQFIDSVSEVINKELRKSYTIDEADKYYEALKIQNYIISRLVAAWREQYAKQKKN